MKPFPPDFQWKRWPKAEALLEGWLDDVVKAMPESAKFIARLEQTSSTRIFDWIDYLIVKGREEAEQALLAEGFEPEEVAVPEGARAYWHPGAQLPRVLLVNAPDGKSRANGFAIKCDAVQEVLLANGMEKPINGGIGTPFRETVVFEENGREIRATERWGYRGYMPVVWSADEVVTARRVAEMWATRQRFHADDIEGVKYTVKLAKHMADLVGPDVAASLAFPSERSYWQRRNRAGQIQKSRQDRLGFGWANHDHHTYRCSRKNFSGIVATFEAFGFHCRERFYAGEEAGWGAQVMEQPVCGLVLFLDVDLSPQEIVGDFAHEDILAERSELGTIGLWVGLHGESLLQAGMHHLEAQFSFDALREDLKQQGIGMMNPFSDMPHLRQAFTEGERWTVEPRRIERLRAKDLITEEQAQTFLEKGAVGSHLENLQRREGFKGFNQHNVSHIIKETDPRKVGAAVS